MKTAKQLKELLGNTSALSNWWGDLMHHNPDIVKGVDYIPIPNTRPKDYELTLETWYYLLIKSSRYEGKRELAKRLAEQDK